MVWARCRRCMSMGVVCELCRSCIAGVLCSVPPALLILRTRRRTFALFSGSSSTGGGQEQ